MASVIRIKRSTANGNPSTLCAGELAYSGTGNGTSSNGEDRLYIGLGTETAGNAANHLVIGGKYFTDMMDHTQGVLTANSALIADSDKKLDNLKVDNLDFNGNTISSTDTNGNIVLDPNGTGYVTITGTNGLVLPVGTTAQRAPNVQGAIRFNTSTSSFEGYSGSNWGSLGGVKSVDGLTYITAETNPGDSDDILSFVTDGTERFFIDTDSAEFDSTVVLRVDSSTASTSTSSGALVVTGGVGIGGDVFIGGDLDVAGTMQFTGATNFDGTVTITGSDTAATEYLIIQNESGDDKFVVDTANGNTTIEGTLETNGKATLNTARVENLTSGRIVFAGTGGDLTDAAGLTWDGTTLTVNGFDVTNNTNFNGNLDVSGDATFDGNVTIGDTTTDTLTVTAKIGSDLLIDSDGAYDLGDTTNRWQALYVDAATITNNTTIGGTLGVTGEATLASATVSDLTNQRIVYAGDSGSLIDSANLTFNGTQLTANALAVTNNATVGGTLGVTGQLTVTAAINANGGISATTGAFSSSVGIDGDFDINTNKFTVASATGNTAIAGTLGVTGATTLSSTLGVTGATTLSGATTIGGSGSEVAVAVDATTLSLDATDTTNLTMTANSSSTKILGIDASNAGTGSAQITIGSSSTDNVTIDSATKTQIDSDTEVEINTAIVDVNATGDVNITSTSGDITFTAGGTIINSDSLDFYGEGGVGNNIAMSIEGSLDVDNIKLNGNTISTTDGSNTLYLDPNPAGSAGTVVIEGNLTVNGTQTTVNSTTVTIDDPIFVLGGDSAPSSDDNLDRGIEYQWHDGTSAKVGFFGYDDSAEEFVFIQDATDTSSVISGDLGAVAFGTARLDGTTTSTSSTTGAFTVAGGAGVGENLNVGGTVTVEDTTQSSSTSTGSIVTAGGVGVAKSIYVGDDIIGAGYATSMIDGFEIDGGTY